MPARATGEERFNVGAAYNNIAWLLSSGVLNSWLQTLSLEIANSANAYKFPNQSGKSGGVSYTFSDFGFDSNLGSSFSLQETGAEQLTVVWNDYDFVLAFNYHVCDVVCESGWVEIFTTQVVPMSVDVALDFSGASVVTTPISALLANQQTAKFIEIYVQCTNTFCLIPTSKIAQAIANGFLGAFDGGVMQAIAAVAAAHPLSTTFTVPLGASALRAALAGVWSLTPNSNLLVSSSGVVGTPTSWPPTPRSPLPSVAVPPAWVQSPPAPLVALLGVEALRGALWSLWQLNQFTTTITAADLPPGSPFQLNTNDVALQGIAPGIAKYPNTAMSVVASAMQPPSVPLPTLNASLSLAFMILVNPPLQAFVLQSNFTAPVALSAANANATTIAVSVGVTWKGGPTSRVLSSAVGAVNAAVWDAALGLYILLNNPQPPTVYVPLPTELVGLSGVSLQTFATASPQPFFALLGTPPPLPPVPSQTCGSGGTHYVCPVANTCCATSGCCPLPNAACCSSGVW